VGSGRAVGLGVAGWEAGMLREESGDSRRVVVRRARAGRPTPAELERLYVASNTGALTPLSQVASLRMERAVPEMQRYNRSRCVTVTANVRTGYNTDRVTRQALERLSHLALPAGYRIVPAAR